MKTPIVITAVHANVYYTTDRPQGTVEVSVEIDGKWVIIVNEKFDPSGFHVSHIVEGAGIERRARAA